MWSGSAWPIYECEAWPGLPACTVAARSTPIDRRSQARRSPPAKSAPIYRGPDGTGLGTVREPWPDTVREPCLLRHGSPHPEEET